MGWQDEYIAEIEKPLRAEIERLRAALRPFADYLAAYEKTFPTIAHSDDDMGWLSSFGRITFGDLRAARAALNEPTGGQNAK